MSNTYVEKYGFVYVWYDRKHKRYYVGSHWGTESDGYICSSRWMRKAYKRRPGDFKRRIVKRIHTNRADLLKEEQRWLDMIQEHELATKNTTEDARIANVRYYNVIKRSDPLWHTDEERRLTIGEKISAAKKGKNTGPRDPEVGRKISEAKKRKFAERRETLGYAFHPEHAAKMASNRAGKPQSEEWKAAQSKRVKQQWADGTRTSVAKIHLS